MLLRACVIATLLALVPAATASAGDAPAPTTHTLFLHPSDALSDIPMNTQPPPEDHVADLGLAPGGSTLSCVPGAPLGAGNEYQTSYAYVTPTLVDYATGQPAVSPVRGFGQDIAVAGGMVLHWYLSPTNAPLALPNVVVRATLRAGDAISVGDQAYNAGEVLAQGESAPALLAGPATTGATHDEVGGRAVYGFTVPLDVAVARLPKDAGVNLRIDTHVLRDECPQEGYAMPGLLAIHSSEGHRPRLAFEGGRPFAAAALVPDVRDDQVVLHADVTAAWGFYDVRDIRLTITGPSAAPTVFGFVFDPRVDGTPFGLTAPFAGTWTWDRAHDGARPGEYTARMEVMDYQGTVHTVAEERFLLGEPARQSPGVPAAGLLLGLGAALAARRRA